MGRRRRSHVYRILQASGQTGSAEEDRCDPQSAIRKDDDGQVDDPQITGAESNRYAQAAFERIGPQARTRET
jgi:hypothetical protein